MNEILKAPFPWFGGKSRAAHLIWPRFGDTPNYVEPFAGSLAVLLARPFPVRTETVNDLDCFLANFWRSIAIDPEKTAYFADYPVNEADLLARHKWLATRAEFRERMRNDPSYHDPMIAGWWVWGLCSWIGSGWCVQRGNGRQPEKIPHLGDAGRGILCWFEELSERLRRVRVACGEWDRVLGESVTIKHGVTCVLLDPPYDESEHDVTYSAESSGVAARVTEWALANGENPLLRIALCGYEGEREMPAGWECVAWKASGGYASAAGNHENSRKERIWFSPHCKKGEQRELI